MYKKLRNKLKKVKREKRDFDEGIVTNKKDEIKKVNFAKNIQTIENRPELKE